MFFNTSDHAHLWLINFPLMMQLSMQGCHSYHHIYNLVSTTILMGWTLHLLGVVLYLKLIKDLYGSSLYIRILILGLKKHVALSIYGAVQGVKPKLRAPFGSHDLLTCSISSEEGIIVAMLNSKWKTIHSVWWTLPPNRDFKMYTFILKYCTCNETMYKLYVLYLFISITIISSFQVKDLKSQVSYFKNVEKQLRHKLGDAGAYTFLSEAVYLISIGSNDYYTPVLTNSSLFASHSHEEYVGMVVGNLTDVIKVNTFMSPSSRIYNKHDTFRYYFSSF